MTETYFWKVLENFWKKNLMMEIRFFIKLVRHYTNWRPFLSKTIL